MNANDGQKLPEGVTDFLLVEGRVFVRVRPDRAHIDLAVRVGNEALRLQEPDTEARRQLAAVLCHRPRFIPGALVRSGGIRGIRPRSVWAGINELADWSLPGGETLQVAFHVFRKNAQVRVNAPIHLPPSRRPLHFSALLAGHRVRGRLQLSHRYRGRKREYALPLEPGKIGGHLPEDYTHLSQELSPLPHESKLHMTLIAEEYVDDGSNLPPYLFLAEPLVHGQDWQPGAALLRLSGQAPEGGEVWFTAPLPGFVTPGHGLELFAGGQAFPILKHRDLQVSLLEDHGTSLLLRASQVGRYRFYLDGEHAFTESLGPDPKRVHFPPRHLNGEWRKLTVTDFSSAQRLLEAQIVLQSLVTPLNQLQKESRPPYPGQLSGQERMRMEGLKTWLRRQPGGPQQANIAHALEVLEGGIRNVRPAPLVLPKWPEVDASVIIVTRDRFRSLYMTLCSLVLACGELRFEVIVVDDASGDATTGLEGLVTNLRLLRNDTPCGFAPSANRAAQLARGRYLVLLGEDGEVASGWLEALADGLERFADAGLVGPRQIHPDGRLFDGGGLLRRDGTALRYGQNENPWDPRYCHARRCDFIGREALMTTRAHWQRAGGLGEAAHLRGFEEIDLALRLRAEGASAWYIPSAVLYRREPGEDRPPAPQPDPETLRAIPDRRAAFTAAWGNRLADIDETTPDRGTRGRILFIDQATPRPDRDAGSYAAIQEMRLVQALGYKVTFAPHDLAHMGAYTDDLERAGTEVVRAPFHLSLDSFLRQHARSFDAFYITRYHVAAEVLATLREAAPGVPVLFNNADLHFLREQRAAALLGDEQSRQRARETRARELDVMGAVDLVLSYSEAEHALIRQELGETVPVAKCPWVVEMPETVPGLKERHGLSFLGSFDHAPNPEAVLWFVSQVLPLIEADDPDQVLHVYGAGMGDRFEHLQGPSLRTVGYVENVADAYDRHRIFIAPLLHGAGIKGKVLAALAHGVPCILSPIAAEGIGCRHGEDCLIASSAQEWREAVKALNTDDALWHRISENARKLIRENYQFEQGLELMRTVFERIGLNG